MTFRERTALILLVQGVVCLVVAAAVFGGWVLAVAAIGVLSVAGGILLGLDDDETVVDDAVAGFELGDLAKSDRPL